MANKLEISPEPPDGGWKVLWFLRKRVLIVVSDTSKIHAQAWLVMFCSFLVNGIVFSIINCFGILFSHLKQSLEEAGDEDASFKCSLVGSLAIGSTFALSFVAGVLVDKVGNI